MSWVDIAKKDFQDAIRSRAFWGLSALFLLLIVGIAYVFGTSDVLASSDAGAEALIFFIASALGTFVSLAAIVVCYRSLAGERESGSMKLLLSLPHTRLDIILGKVVGRAGVLAVPIVVALTIGTLFGTALLGDIAPVSTILFGLVTLLFAVTYASIIVGFSAMTKSTTRSATLAVGFFVIVELFWNVVLLAIRYVINGFSFTGLSEAPAWFYPLSQLSPSTAFTTALTAVVSGGSANGGTGLSPEQFDAFYASRWIAFLALAFWIVVPIAVGYWRFDATDL